jgi:hypothetical protein
MMLKVVPGTLTVAEPGKEGCEIMPNDELDRDITMLNEVIDGIKTQAIGGDAAAVHALLNAMEERNKLEGRRDQKRRKNENHD